MVRAKLFSATVLVLTVFSLTSQAIAAPYDTEFFSSGIAGASVQKMRWSDNETYSESLRIMVNTSQVLRFDRAIVRVAISNPEVADLAMVGQKDILLNAKKPGNANLLVWDEEARISSYSIQSFLDVEKLEKVLRSIDPTAVINILPLNSSAAIYGTVETNQKLKQISDAAKAFDANTLVFMKLRDSKQVLLEVRFAEVDRRKTKEFKLDWSALFSKFAIGNYTGQTGGSLAAEGDNDPYAPRGASVGHELFDVPTESVGNLPFSYFSGTFGIQNFLKWLEGKNILKIIARPNLVTKDGEPAEFKVGGEYPVPIATGTGGQISIQYREYGTILKFTPEVLDNDVMRLKISAEVSELDFTNAVTSGGVSVPGLTKRSEETVAELRDNQTLVIGGFISQRINKITRKTPKLGDAPIIGKLFNAEEYAISEVELLITVTPHLVKPLELNEKKDLYKAEEVKEAIQISVPPYPDAQGDTINNMMTQGEKMRDFDQDIQAKEFIDSMKSRFPEKPKPVEPVKPSKPAIAVPAPKKAPALAAPVTKPAPATTNFTPKNQKIELPKPKKPAPAYEAPASQPITNFTFSDRS